MATLLTMAEEKQILAVCDYLDNYGFLDQYLKLMQFFPIVLAYHSNGTWHLLPRNPEILEDIFVT